MSRRIFLSVLPAALVSLAGCSGKKLTKKNFDRIEVGMSPKEVEAILGSPVEIGDRDNSGTPETVHLWKSEEDKAIIVYFQGGKVVRKGKKGLD